MNRFLEDLRALIGEERRHSTLDLIGAVFAFIVTFLLFYPFSLVGVDAHHDGILLKPALDVLRGQVLFRDTFSQYGAVTTYIQSAFLLGFGPTLKVMKISVVVFYALSAWALWLSSSFFLPRSLTLLSFLVWLSLAPFYGPTNQMVAWSSVYALFFQAFAQLCVLYSLRSSRPGIWAWAAGISVALTFLCRQPAGILTFVAVFLTFLISARVRDGRFRLVDGQGAPNLTVTFTSGVALILSIFLAWLVSQGALHDWIFQQFTWPRMWLGRVGGTGVLRILQSLFPVKDYNSFLVLGVIAVALAFRTGTKKTWRFWLILALVVAVVNVFDRKLFLLPASWAIPVPLTVLVFFVVGFWALVRKRLILNFQLMPVAAMVLIGLASWAQYYPVHCINHIYWGLSPSIGFFIFLWFVAVRRSQWVTFGVISAFWLPGVAHDFKMIYQNFSRPLKVFEQAGPLTGMWVAPDHYTAWVQLIEAINQYLASRPATPMLIISIDALPATLVANLKNPGPFYVDWAITDLSAERVRFIDENLPLIFRKDVKVSPELEAAISRHHYELLASNPLGAVYGVPLL